MSLTHDDSLEAPLIADAELVITVAAKDTEQCKQCWWHPDALFWRGLHAIAFIIGGTTFLTGATLSTVNGSLMCLKP
jgi:hypothetical protein